MHTAIVNLHYMIIIEKRPATARAYTLNPVYTCIVYSLVSGICMCMRCIQNNRYFNVFVRSFICNPHLGRHFFFIFRFTSPPTLHKLTRRKIKIPIIYFLLLMGRFIFSKSTKWQTFSITHVKTGKCQFYF